MIRTMSMPFCGRFFQQIYCTKRVGFDSRALRITVRLFSMIPAQLKNINLGALSMTV